MRLHEGDVVFLRKGFPVYAEREYETKEWVLVDEVTQKLVSKTNKCETNTELSSDEAGEYVVECAKMDGGGTGHGPGDVYPDGWEVTLRKLDFDGYNPNGSVVWFYQSGCFSVVNDEDFVVTRTMEKTFA